MTHATRSTYSGPTLIQAERGIVIRRPRFQNAPWITPRRSTETARFSASSSSSATISVLYFDGLSRECAARPNWRRALHPDWAAEREFERETGTRGPSASSVIAPPLPSRMPRETASPMPVPPRAGLVVRTGGGFGRRCPLVFPGVVSNPHGRAFRGEPTPLARQGKAQSRLLYRRLRLSCPFRLKL
jgi:hypothetical protein